MVYGEERLERSDHFHFLQDLQCLPHTSWHHHHESHLIPLTRVSPVAPPTCICGFDRGQEWSVCVQGLAVNTQKGCESGLWGWNLSWWPGLVSRFLSSASSCSQAGTGCLCVPERWGAWQLSATLPAQSGTPWTQAMAMHLGSGGSQRTA